MIELGQKVVLERLDLRIAYKGAPLYSWATVCKVGRKYFQVDILNGVNFMLEDLRQVSEFTPSYRIVLSEEALYEELSAQTALKKLQNVLSYYSTRTFTSAQLLSACSALGLSEEVDSELTPKIEKLMEDLSDE